MIHHACLQNTPEWRMLRCGLPTASQFHRIVTPTGKASSQREVYMYQLLAERIQGRPLDDRKFTWAMERGSQLEHKAVEYFEFETDLQTQACGFITDDFERWGASPDRLIGETGLLQCKAPELPTHMMYLMHEGSAYQDYRTQAQGELWVAERQELWFLSFYPDLPWSLYKVGREDPFIAKLSQEVQKFSEELEALAIRVKDRGWFRLDSIREPQESEQSRLVKAMKDSLIEVNKGT